MSLLKHKVQQSEPLIVSTVGAQVTADYLLRKKFELKPKINTQRTYQSSTLVNPSQSLDEVLREVTEKRRQLKKIPFVAQTSDPNTNEKIVQRSITKIDSTRSALLDSYGINLHYRPGPPLTKGLTRFSDSVNTTLTRA